MVQTRSGAGIPSTTPVDVPEQIEFEIQEQPLTTPTSRIGELDQTPGQAPDIHRRHTEFKTYNGEITISSKKLQTITVCVCTSARLPVS